MRRMSATSADRSFFSSFCTEGGGGSPSFGSGSRRSRASTTGFKSSRANASTKLRLGTAPNMSCFASLVILLNNVNNSGADRAEIDIVAEGQPGGGGGRGDPGTLPGARLQTTHHQHPDALDRGPQARTLATTAGSQACQLAPGQHPTLRPPAGEVPYRLRGDNHLENT